MHRFSTGLKFRKWKREICRNIDSDLPKKLFDLFQKKFHGLEAQQVTDDRNVV